MEQDCARPKCRSSTAEFVVLTDASPSEEKEFLSNETTSTLTGNNGFAPGRTVFIEPYAASLADQESYVEYQYRMGAVLKWNELQLGQGRYGIQAFVQPPGGSAIEMIDLPCTSAHKLRRSGGDQDLQTITLRQVVAGSDDDTALISVATSLACG